MIPLEIEEIILNYKKDLDYNQRIKNHRISYESTLDLIKGFSNLNTRYLWANNMRKTITIGPMFKNNHTYCYCFSICLYCNNFISSSRMSDYNIAKICKCHH
tara:strand:+ start:1326 stop:1631 length:306 start_codon:yes stop_codon:yes gene_type:complete